MPFPLGITGAGGGGGGVVVVVVGGSGAVVAGTVVVGDGFSSARGDARRGARGPAVSATDLFDGVLMVISVMIATARTTAVTARASCRSCLGTVLYDESSKAKRHPRRGVRRDSVSLLTPTADVRADSVRGSHRGSKDPKAH
jgi:uncharacterized membrane protein